MNAHARTRSTDAQYIRATKDRAARTRSCWPRGAVPCAACPVCVSASSRSRSTVRESGSGPRCHGSDGVLPSGRDRREAGGGAAAAADAPAAQSCRAGERWHTARRRRRPPRWLSLSSADAASRLGGGSCFAARVARRRTRLRSAAAARSERAGIALGRTRASREKNSASFIRRSRKILALGRSKGAAKTEVNQGRCEELGRATQEPRS